MYCINCGKQLDGDAVLCPECEAAKKQSVTVRRNSNALALSGFILTFICLALAFAATTINHYRYTGVNFQFFFLIPLAVSAALSIAGSVKAAKSNAGLGLGIAGSVVSLFFLVGTALYYLLAEKIAKFFLHLYCCFLFCNLFILKRFTFLKIRI